MDVCMDVQYPKMGHISINVNCSPGTYTKMFSKWWGQYYFSHWPVCRYLLGLCWRHWFFSFRLFLRSRKVVQILYKISLNQKIEIVIFIVNIVIIHNVCPLRFPVNNFKYVSITIDILFARNQILYCNTVIGYRVNCIAWLCWKSNCVIV